MVTDKLNEFFPRIMDIAFTRYMEEQLDKIEEQHLDWLGVLKDFYGPFKQNLDTAQAQMQRTKATPSEYKCPQCGQQLVYRFGKTGKFLGCSGYPNCSFTCPCDEEGKMVEEKVSEHKCPNCGKPMSYRNGRFGPFLGCSDYPDCKTTLKLDKYGKVIPPKAPPEPTEIACYKCKEGQLVIRQGKNGPFLGCSRYPKCKTIVSIKQLEHLKQLQQAGQWPPKTAEAAKQILARGKIAAETPRHTEIKT